MKRLFLTTTFLIIGTIGLLAQGKVSVDNNPYLMPGSVEQGGTIDYNIYKAPDQLADIDGWRVQVWENGTSALGDMVQMYGSVWPGVINPTSDLANGGLRTVGVAGGATTTLELRVYDATGAFIGGSPQFEYIPPTSQTPTPDQILMVNFRGFVVPEPSTIALGVLGLGALLLFRRRK